jgi:hypothetical protein
VRGGQVLGFCRRPIVIWNSPGIGLREMYPLCCIGKENSYRLYLTSFFRAVGEYESLNFVCKILRSIRGGRVDG